MILIGIAAILNAMMDVLENENFSTSIFRNLNPRFWYKRESWKYAKRVFNYKIDAWHLAKSAMIVALCWEAANSVAEFVAFGLVWVACFNVSYRIFKGWK